MGPCGLGRTLLFNHSNQQFSVTKLDGLQLAVRVNYTDLDNTMQRMRGHVSADFFHCNVLFLQGKHNGFRHASA